MKLIDRQYLATPFYGTRKIAAYLKSQGHLVNRKRVRRLMRLMGLKAIYRRPRMSKPAPGHKIYPYLLGGMAVTRPNQVWAADITYLKLDAGFVYLVAIMDLYSRKVLSWRISLSMDSEFCIEAVKEAMARYGVPAIFNTDQGSQFTSYGFMKVLKDACVEISMDGQGRWRDNIYVERFWRTLKYEDIYLKAYESVRELKTGLSRYFRFYNTDRYHQGLDYQTPEQMYESFQAVAKEAVA